MKYNGQDLIAMGCPRGREFGEILRLVNAEPHTPEQVQALIQSRQPLPALEQRQTAAPCQYNISADNDIEKNNVEAVRKTMDVVLCTPVVVEGAVMPDACPAGPVGTIPVGGVVAARDAIIPGMHSADICCSLMATVFENSSPAQVMDAAHNATHFGPGGRETERAVALSDSLAEAVAALPYPGLRDIAHTHMGTQGDGNHFMFVGTLESTGQTVLVTHHGSRGFGARLFKQGMKMALQWRDKLSPTTAKANAWIPFDTDDGQSYWQALQVVRAWTRENHECLHDMTLESVNGEISTRFWNEHNFVFREEQNGSNLFWHAKGATPIHNDFMEDTSGVQIVPLNMAQPVLFVKGERNASNRGFAPHGAGRNMSRTQHKKKMSGRTDAEILEAETKGLDVRFYSGITDISELPGAYKNADTVVRDMDAFSLASVVDKVLPYGSIMAGDWQKNAPWRLKRKQRTLQKKEQQREKKRLSDL
ncbi:RNA-splicing ligase RtcB [Chromatiales bacterium (ex Bugula neritina AB1)]|nr:RNA-splicing ligase RtcB [Chromatiales bacterium (ex Bugula neritina AB1)]